MNQSNIVTFSGASCRYLTWFGLGLVLMSLGCSNEVSEESEKVTSAVTAVPLFREARARDLSHSVRGEPLRIGLRRATPAEVALHVNHMNALKASASTAVEEPSIR
jgi:hypothetical protein